AGPGEAVGHAEGGRAGRAAVDVELQRVVLGAAGVGAEGHRGDERGKDADDAPGARGVHAHPGVEVPAHELVAAGGVHVVHAGGEGGAERAFEADGDLVRVGHTPVRAVQGHDAGVAHA